MSPLDRPRLDRIKAGTLPAATYVGKYARLRGEYNYLWDELSAIAGSTAA